MKLWRRLRASGKQPAGCGADRSRGDSPRPFLVCAGVKEKWGQPCGRPHSHRRVDPEGRLTPGVSMPSGMLLQASQTGFSVARRSRRCRFRRGLSFGPKTSAVPPGGSETGLSTWNLERLPLCPKALPQPRRQTGKSDLADFAPPRFQRFEIRTTRGLSWSHPSTAMASPSRRAGSKIPSSSPAFPPLSRKGQSPSR
jgi:hypothetical protein